jgi:hypothetical protein
MQSIVSVLEETAAYICRVEHSSLMKMRATEFRQNISNISSRLPLIVSSLYVQFDLPPDYHLQGSDCIFRYNKLNVGN